MNQKNLLWAGISGALGLAFVLIWTSVLVSQQSRGYAERDAALSARLDAVEKQLVQTQEAVIAQQQALVQQGKLNTTLLQITDALAKRE